MDAPPAHWIPAEHAAQEAELAAALKRPAAQIVHVAPVPDPASAKPAGQKQKSDAPVPVQLKPADAMHVLAPAVEEDPVGQAEQFAAPPAL